MQTFRKPGFDEIYRTPKGMLMATAMLSLSLTLPGCRRSESNEGAHERASHSNRDILLSLHGSNTIGAKMGPALARAYLMHLGADTVFQENGATAEETYVHGRFGKGEKIIEFWSYGSNTGFNDLAWGKCDIGMSSKPIDNQNVQRLAALGDMHSPANEHIIGLDGITIIVHPGNPIEELAVEKVAAIYSGRVKDWSEISGSLKGPITLYTRDKNSGTFDVFSHSVLGKEPLSESGVVCESNEKLASAVAGNPLGIGYAPVGTMQGDKALKIRSGDAIALSPSKVNIVTEDYPLARRLFLYTPGAPNNAQVKPFIEFAQSEAGQLEVERSGFIAQILRLSKPEIRPQAPSRYLSEVKDALRMAIDFRFHPGSFDLDNKARQDLGRLAHFLDHEQLRTCRLKLFGFCDSKGKADRNYALSSERAKVVAEALHGDFGIAPALVLGMGSALPIASNETEGGREKNRRIEVWLQCSSDPTLAEQP